MREAALPVAVVAAAVAVVAVRLAPLFSPYCDYDELAHRLVPLRRRLDEGVPVFEGAPAAQTAPLTSVMSEPSAGGEAPIPEVEGVGLAREMMEHHLPFVLRNVSSVAALHRRWRRGFLSREAGSTEMFVDTYEGLRLRYVGREAAERVRRGAARAMEASGDHPREAPNMTLSELLEEMPRRVYAMKAEDASFPEEALVQASLGEAVEPLLEGRWRRRNTTELRMGFGEVHYGLHWDLPGNFLAQVAGRKRVVVFHPLQESRLPWQRERNHPHFRQSPLWPRDVFDDPFAVSFGHVEAMQAWLEPGDVLYLPPVWFHYIEALPVEGWWVTVNQWLEEESPGGGLRCPPRRELFTVY